MVIEAELALIRAQLQQLHDPGRAQKEKAYLKSPYKFYGVSLPALREIAVQLSRKHQGATYTQLLSLSQGLWDSDVHQEKTLALLLLQCRKDLLDYECMPMLEAMLGGCTGWDHADQAAIHLVGAVLMKDVRAFDYLIKWGGARGLWLRRAALTSQILLLRKGAGNVELLRTLASTMLEEKEFFLRKAIGWCVRELSKADPKAAAGMLMEFKSLGASGLTLREGAKRLPEKARRSILANPAGKAPRKKA